MVGPLPRADLRMDRNGGLLEQLYRPPCHLRDVIHNLNCRRFVEEQQQIKDSKDLVGMVFRLLDKDKNGVLDCSELFDQLQSLDASLWPQRRLQRIFNEMDVDQDNAVTYNEFEQWLFSGSRAREQEDFLETVGLERDQKGALQHRCAASATSKAGTATGPRKPAADHVVCESEANAARWAASTPSGHRHLSSDPMLVETEAPATRRVHTASGTRRHHPPLDPLILQEHEANSTRRVGTANGHRRLSPVDPMLFENEATAMGRAHTTNGGLTQRKSDPMILDREESVSRLSSAHSWPKDSQQLSELRGLSKQFGSLPQLGERPTSQSGMFRRGRRQAVSVPGGHHGRSSSKMEGKLPHKKLAEDITDGAASLDLGDLFLRKWRHGAVNHSEAVESGHHILVSLAA
mmetsp:Transcript_49680/g.118337  ORF Transcript_49680/g.118337 Transcript_49680/m.118337 type:complete len:405 (+) Transcript_49680:75-1289(+)